MFAAWWGTHRTNGNRVQRVDLGIEFRRRGVFEIVSSTAKDPYLLPVPRCSKTTSSYSDVLDVIFDVHPGMDMGIAAEVPDHIGTFNLKDIPYAVIADIFSLVECEVQIVETAFLN